jgi:hypothetical protein
MPGGQRSSLSLPVEDWRGITSYVAFNSAGDKANQAVAIGYIVQMFRYWRLLSTRETEDLNVYFVLDCTISGENFPFKHLPKTSCTGPFQNLT